MPAGTSARSNPSLPASLSRSAPCATGRTSPDNETSPNATASADTGRSLSAETSAAATARSAAGSVTRRSEEHTSELQSLMRISYAVFCLKKKQTEREENDKTENALKKEKT